MYFSKINSGVLYMLIASFFFALMGVFVKLLSSSLGVLEIAFFRNIFGVALIGATIFSSPLKNKGGKIGLLFFRCIIGFLALLAWFYNIAHTSLADAMTFSRTAPIFTAVIAFFALNERLGKKGWAAIFIGFVGIIFIMKPSGLTLKITDIMGLFSGFGAALAYTSVRELKKYYDTRTIVLFFMATGTVGPVLIALADRFLNMSFFGELFGEVTMPYGINWFYIVCMGIFATIAQIFMTRAYGAARAGIVSAVSYADILFSVLFGMIVWSSFPDLIGLFGIILVILGGILVAKEKI
ncbi:MAG: DMT family transporter [Campylobacteraceae bacterium]|jgi:drug/metabolite transporter (DMT)-like permease|nr:DMT family transporter [Campylobacteraceae bacterium]